MPAKAGIQFSSCEEPQFESDGPDSRFRGNDGHRDSGA
jgi:hypothetical protein